MRELRTIIPKAEYVKLRKIVLAHLKRNSDANGWCHVTRSAGLEQFVMYNKDMRPFTGMSPIERDAATRTFWESLLKSGLVKCVMANSALDEHKMEHYYLTGTEPFHKATRALLGIESEENE